MAQSLIPPPEKMVIDGDIAGNWQFFKDSWDNYAIATGLDKKDKTIQVATLLTVMGKDCHTIYKNLPMTEEERKDPADILKKLTEHFEPTKNTIYERFLFNSCVQGSDPFDTFVSKLRQLAATCEYGELQDQLIRDRIVIGLNDQAQRARLLREKDLTLGKAISLCRSSEITSLHMQKMTQSEDVHFVKNKQKDKKWKRNCSFCCETHERRKCPAFKHICTKCNQPNHFEKACQNTDTGRSSQRDQQKSYKKRNGRKKTYMLQEESTSESEVDSSYAVSSTNMKKAYYTDVKVKSPETGNYETIKFQLDSASTGSTMRLEDYHKLTTKMPEKTNKKLRMYNNELMTPVGHARLKCKANNITLYLHVDVVKDAPISLLSGRACEAFKLMQIDRETVYRVTEESLTKERVVKDYKDVFRGIGDLGEYHIEIDKSVTPKKNNARKIPAPLKEEVRTKLNQLESDGIIAKVKQPTDWINSMVAVKKPNKLRLCIDPANLNVAIKRNHYPTPTIDDVMPKLTKARVFSVADAKDGFLQVRLDEKSSYLTTFYTPFGLYRWLRMPFGIKSAPEEFQRRLDENLEGLENVAVIADDILIYGTGETDIEAEKSHDNALIALFERCRERRIKINQKKLRFKLDSVTYMGHVFSKKGVSPDPEKILAITQMNRPEDVKAVQRLLGVATYLAKFVPKLSTVSEPLRRLTDQDSVFEWMPQHEDAFNEMKKLLSQAPVLQYYDVNEPVVLESDSSDVGLGAVITQKGKPIAYASRALTSTERNYAQIEKECLSLVFAAERFEHYILGKSNVKMLTDHKPLETIFRKPILTCPKRLQRMRLRLQKFDIDVQYKPGPTMFISDTLSRAALPLTEQLKDKSEYLVFQLKEEFALNAEIESDDMESDVFVTDQRLCKIREATSNDPMMQTLAHIVMKGWPQDKRDVPLCIQDYWPYRDELTTLNGIVYRGTRIIIPTEMRSQMLERAHASHLGEQYTLSTAREIMYWPKMHNELIRTVKECNICQEDQPSQPAEKMMSHPIPTNPWQSVSSDCFELDNEHYVVVVDAYSGYMDFARLKNLSGKALIEVLRPIFATHGAPAEMITDNGSNYVSREFQEFAREWEFLHVLSSPHHKKSNGRAEVAVKVMKKLLKKSKKAKVDIYKSLLEWRNTVTPGTNSSPMQKLMSRRARSFLPCKEEKYSPKIVSKVPENIIERKRISKYYHDKSARTLPELIVGQPVRVKTHPQLKNSPWKQGTVQSIRASRSYDVQVDGATYKRNRIHLRDSILPPPKPAPAEEQLPADEQPETPVEQTNKPDVQAEPAKQIPPAKRVSSNNRKSNKVATVSSNTVTTRSGRQVKPNPKYAD